MTSRLARSWPTLAAGLVVVAGLVFTRALGTRTTYDEGVYLASLDALRRGQELGSDLYTSQPPAFYWVLRALAAPFGTSIAGIRVGFALLAVGVLASVMLAWRLYGPPAGVAAGALVAIGPPYPSVAPMVAADVPAVALGLISLALVAFAVRDGASRAWPVAAGAVYALAVLTKLLAAPFVVPFVALALAARAGRRALPAAALGAAALTAGIVVVHAGALGDIWAAVAADHTGARKLGSFSENAHRIRDLLEPRTPFGWLVPAGFVAFLAFPRVRRTWPLWTFPPPPRSSCSPSDRSPTTTWCCFRPPVRSLPGRAWRSRSRVSHECRGSLPPCSSLSSWRRACSRSSDVFTATTSPSVPR